MTVAELITELQKYPGVTEVLCNNGPVCINDLWDGAIEMF